MDMKKQAKTMQIETCLICKAEKLADGETAVTCDFCGSTGKVLVRFKPLKQIVKRILGVGEQDGSLGEK